MRTRNKQFTSASLVCSLLLAVAFAEAETLTAACVAAPQGLVHWWKAEGTANDSSDSLNGQLYGGTSFAPGMVGQAFRFDGVSSSVTNSRPGLSNILDNYTMELWAWPTAGRASTPEDWSGIYGISGQRYAIFPLNGLSGPSGAGISIGTNGVSVFEHGYAQMPALLVYDTLITNWTHVVVVYSNRQPSLYLNGALVHTGLQSVNHSFPSTWLGAFGAESLGDGYYAGLLDEVSIYDRALNQQEVASIYAAGSSGKCSPAPCAPAPQGLVHWWKAEGTANDSSDSLNGQLYGGTSFAPGMVGQAFRFDGVSGSVTNSRPGLSNILDNYTVELWAWPTAGRASTPENLAGIYGTSGQRYAIFPLNGLSGPSGAGLSIGTNGVSVFEHGYAQMPALLVYDTPITNWTHVAVVYSNRQPSLYLNGALVHTGLQSVNHSFPSTWLGEFGAESPGYGYYAGLLDEVAIYDRVLSQQEIASIYAAGSAGKCSLPSCTPAPSGMVGWWRGDGNAYEEIGGGHGTLIGQAKFQNGAVGEGFTFDGNGDAVLIGNPAALQLQDFTIEAWIQRASPSAVSLSSYMGMIFAYGAGGYGLYLDSDGRPRLSKIDYDSVICETNITDTSLHHIAVTKLGTNVVFYVDGIAHPVAGGYNTVFTFTSNAQIGAWNSDQEACFFGSIDELSIYGRPLEASEITSIFQASAAGKCLLPKAPSIFREPTSKAVFAGDPFSLEVVALGSAPLWYQWLFNGTNVLPNATNAVLEIPEAQQSDAGRYSVVVSNSVGSVTSAVAVVTVESVGVCIPPPQGLVAWWKGEMSTLDETSRLRGELFGPVSYVSGKVGAGFQFNGAGQGIVVENAAALQIQDFTIEAWVKRNSLDNVSWEGGIGMIFSYGTGGYGLYLDPSGVPSLTQVDFSYVAGGPPIKDTAFHHLAVTKRGSEIIFYVDGIGYSAPAYAPTFTFGSNPQVGALGSGHSATFNGVIDEVSVYSRALTPYEMLGLFKAGEAGKCTTPAAPELLIQPLDARVIEGQKAAFSVVATGTAPLFYTWMFNGTPIPGANSQTLSLSQIHTNQAGAYSVLVTNQYGSAISSTAVLTVDPVPPCTPAPSGMVGWWRGNGNPYDEIGGNDGILVGQAKFQNGAVGEGFTFDGNGDAVLIGNPAALQLQDFTIEAWIQRSNPIAVSLSSYMGMIFAYGGGGYGLYLDSDGRPRLSKIDYDSVICETNITDTSLHHIAVTKLGTNVIFYVDGIAHPVAGGYNAVFTFTSNAQIGAWNYGQEACFFGSIDELSIYGRPLEASEISSIFQASAGGKCLTPVAPTILRQPESVLVGSGSNVTLSATVNGSAPLRMQWFHEDVPVPGATRSDLELERVTPELGGIYRLAVSNQFGTALSSNAVVRVIVYAPVATDSFDSGIRPAMWASFGGLALATNYGGYRSAPSALWLGGDGSRFAQTQPIDMTMGGSLQFYLRYGSGNSAVWDYVEMPTKAVVVEYLPAGSTNWVEMARCTYQFSWARYSVVLPDAARTSATSFRWRQLANAGAAYDHWALDDVSITAGPAVPVMGQLPQSQTAVLGSSISFAGSALGTTPMAYAWSFNGNPIPGADKESLLLTNVQFANSGTYTLTVSNSEGIATSSAMLTVTYPPADLRVEVSGAASGQLATVPVKLVANGVENAIGFSVAFPPELLTFDHAALGSDASSASLVVNTNNAGIGRVGIILSLPSQGTFAAGTQAVAQLVFRTALVTNETRAEVSFSGLPVGQELVSVDGQQLALRLTPGAVEIAAALFEGDVSPVPAGDHNTTVADWVLLGRYATKLDSPASPDAFQRADCAPRATLGDGEISLIDWVQAGRYAARLDDLTLVGGPTETADRPSILRNKKDLSAATEVRVGEVAITPGIDGVLPIYLVAQGRENALSFTIAFDPGVLKFVNVATAGIAGGSININSIMAESGKVGLALALSPGQAFPVGTNEVARLEFKLMTAPVTSTAVSLSDDPVRREISDVNAARLEANYFNGQVSPLLPALTASLAKEAIQVSWPGWATNFTLECTPALGASAQWSPAPGTRVLSGGENRVILPFTNAASFYRLRVE